MLFLFDTGVFVSRLMFMVAIHEIFCILDFIFTLRGYFCVIGYLIEVIEESFYFANFAIAEIVHSVGDFISATDLINLEVIGVIEELYIILFL